MMTVTKLDAYQLQEVMKYFINVATPEREVWHIYGLCTLKRERDDADINFISEVLISQMNDMLSGNAARVRHSSGGLKDALPYVDLDARTPGALHKLVDHINRQDIDCSTAYIYSMNMTSEMSDSSYISVAVLTDVMVDLMRYSESTAIDTYVFDYDDVPRKHS